MAPWSDELQVLVRGIPFARTEEVDAETMSGVFVLYTF